MTPETATLIRESTDLYYRARQTGAGHRDALKMAHCYRVGDPLPQIDDVVIEEPRAKVHYCLDCGKRNTPVSLRCRQCATTYRHRYKPVDTRPVTTACHDCGRPLVPRRLDRVRRCKRCAAVACHADRRAA